MSDEAQVTMMLYFGFKPDEEAKLQTIENGVISHVLKMHGNVKPIWQCSSSGTFRSIQLCVPVRPLRIIWQVSADQLATMSSADVLAGIQQ